jgi:hypothetical protein
MTVSKIDTSRVRTCIEETIEQPRSKTVDVHSLLDSLVTTVESRIEDGENPIDATWEVLEIEEPYDDMSHTERLYTIGFLFTNFGLEETWLTEDRRVSHGETWDDVTLTLCERAVYEIVHGLATGEIEPDPHTMGSFHDTRTGRQVIDFTEDIRTDPLRNTDVHNWIASLSMDVSTRIANFDDVDTEDRSSEQGSLTREENETEAQAIHDVIEKNARDELLTGNLITTGSFLDALEDLYDMDGKLAIEHEQLSKTAAAAGWHEAITSGLLWHAMEQAIKVHRETFADEFKRATER